MTVKNLTTEQLQVLADRINEIAGLALTLRETGNRIIAEADAESAYHGTVVGTFAEHIGALADNCTDMLDPTIGPVVGDFMDWRMSPLEREHVARLKPAVHARAQYEKEQP